MKATNQKFKTLLGGTAPAILLTLGLPTASLDAREITVPSGSILTLQQAVDAAAPGDTVVVRPGTYGNVTISPSKTGLKLKAAGPSGSVQVVGLGGEFWNVGIDIQADDVSVEGFTVSHATIGIRSLSTSHGVRVTGNQIGNLPGPYGAALSVDHSSGVEIARNTLFGTLPSDGVSLWISSAIHVHDKSATDCSLGGSFIVLTGSTGCEIDHNTLALGGLPNSGVFLNGWPQAGPNTQHHIHHNWLSNAGQGIFLWLSPDCLLDHNACDHNEMGIYLANSPKCTVDHNEANNNRQAGNWGTGISVGGSPDSIITYNVANGNSSWGIIVGNSCGTVFDHNSAEGNVQWDLFAPVWGDSDPACNTYLDNHASTAWPSLNLWGVK